MKLLNWLGSLVIGLIGLAFAGVAIALFGFIAFSSLLGDYGAPKLLAKEVAERTEAAASKLTSKLSKQELKPIVSAKAPEVVTPKATVHTVKRGEWLSKIAAKYNTTVEQIVDANKETYPSLRRNPNLIHKGWSLAIKVETHSSPENSVAYAKQSVYPEKTAKAASRDKHNASKKTDTPKIRVASKKHRNASRSTEKKSEKITLLTACERAWGHTKPKKGESVIEAAERIREHFGPTIAGAARENGVDPLLVIAKLIVESNGYPCAVSSTGCRGIAQFTKGTAKELGMPLDQVFDPKVGIRYGARLLRMYRNEMGTDKLGLSAYNIGPENVRWLEKTDWKKTREFCERGVCYHVSPRAVSAYARQILNIRARLQESQFSL